MTDITTKNREHFDKVATSLQNDFAELIQAVSDELQARRLWMSDVLDINGDGVNPNRPKVRVLDYACGTGTASVALVPFADQVVGLDLSLGMVKEYNKRASDLGLDASRMQAWQHNLLGKAPLPEGLSKEQLSNFDIAIISMALHHVADPGELMRQLAACLRPGGICVVLDMVSVEQIDQHVDNHPHHDHGGEAHHSPSDQDRISKDLSDAVQTIHKRGFSEEQMKDLYEAVGMGQGFEYVVIDRPFYTLSKKKTPITAFITRGVLG